MTKKTVSTLDEVGPVKAYLDRVGAESRSMRTAAVKEKHGAYWKDIATIKFDVSGKVTTSSPQFSPTELEAAQIEQAFGEVDWPRVKPLKRLYKEPDQIKDADPKNVFEFRDKEGSIIMVQVRTDLKDGDKRYVPWTYWSDDKWRCMEPDGSLPFYNADRINESATVFIHEGAKAARHCQWMVDGETAEARKALDAHPWGSELAGAVHIGWIGGALSPHRTNWRSLKELGVKRAYIVADKDKAGVMAVPAISYNIKVPAFMIQFTDEFPGSFDLGDDFPDRMFGGSEGAYYVGPAFRDCLHPATWATDLIPPAGRGKPTPVLREAFKGQWSWVEEIEMFVCNEMPDIMRSEQGLNKMLAPYSNTTNVSGLIVKNFTGRTAKICYRPDEKGQVVSFKGTSAINLHVPTQIRSSSGDITPFLEFMEYMFVHEKERKEAMKWCATLIGRPEIRMGYGMLLISETQGVGKTTLGSSILAPLVGPQNVGYPGEADILSPFNDWVAHKRLAIVSEIYSGASWKAYHALKAVVTDKDIRVNKKYMAPYTIENWCHVLASSNSMRALKMENDDRRWFYPEVTEVCWPRNKFSELREWLETGGLKIIKAWAEGYGDYVHPADRAPMTERKREMIEGSRSEAQREAAAIAGTIQGMKEPAAVLIKDVISWVRGQSQGRVFDSDYEIRKSMLDEGVLCWKDRVKVGGRLQYAILNEGAFDLAQRSESPAAEIRSHIKRCQDIMEGEM